ncbi:pentapeptide repeat-containing protein [Paenibacillus sp. Marseille-Q4541]|uniref:pentapeptide repeat-containing protein n=1 Tax=Paenibacillus sp. Marseille-Q4541 TaxID=2831522 RepID=UPI001BA9F91A|nr:pentapeptide repeat-containing protein [Paenibacillus sp. Marseille-Q4541]
MSNTETAPLKIIRPKLPKHLETLDLTQTTIDDRSELAQSVCEEQELSYVTADKVLFDQMQFHHVTFSHVSFPHAELTDVVFSHCDLSNVDFSESVLHRVRFEHCKIIGMDLTATTLRNIVFTDCAGDYATFRFSNMKLVSFQDNSLLKSDFYHSEFTKVEFSRCMLNEAQFSGTSLKGIDLSNTEFFNLGVTLEDLQGCIISPAQAILFTKIFGLVIKE